MTKVEQTDQEMIVQIDRLGKRLLRCGVCRNRCRQVHDVRKQREWRDLCDAIVPVDMVRFDP